MYAGPIAAMFWHNEEYATGLGSDIYLDGVVCVVDAVFGEQVDLHFASCGPNLTCAASKCQKMLRMMTLEPANGMFVFVSEALGHDLIPFSDKSPARMSFSSTRLISRQRRN